MWHRAEVTEYDIRPVEVDERRAVIDAFRTALLTGPVNDEAFEAGMASWDDSDGLAAWDGDRCAGCVAAFRFDSTIPGGALLPTAGVTRVGVLPTDTRRGLLTRMMHRLLAESRERGNVLATLHASETSIYRRFGFGLATDDVSVEVTTRAATPWRLPARPGSMRLLGHGEVLDAVPPLYERVARWRVGTISRPRWMWQRILKDASKPVDDPFGKGTFVAVHTGADGADDGYVHYSVSWDDAFATNPAGRGEVHDLWGSSPEVELELWRYLLGIDLIVQWRAEVRPVDEPVRRAMHDSRAYEAKRRLDDQWLRILDADAALAVRAYGVADAAVTITVDDPMFADNCGTWRLSSTGAERIADVHTSDVTLDIAALSTAYLGAVSWSDLATIGLVTATPDTVARLDLLFGVRPTPFCGSGY
jgi:predicted acetyltransferase